MSGMPRVVHVDWLSVISTAVNIQEQQGMDYLKKLRKLIFGGF